MTLCCSNCFHDSAIIRTIGLNHTNDRCGYCKKENAFTINPKDLSRFFEPFLGIVVESEKGELLSDILQNTFNIFNEKIHNTKNYNLVFFFIKQKCLYFIKIEAK